MNKEQKQIIKEQECLVKWAKDHNDILTYNSAKYNLNYLKRQFGD